MKFNKQALGQKINQLKDLLIQNKITVIRAGGLLAVGAGLIVSVHLLYHPEPALQPSAESVAETAETEAETTDAQTLESVETTAEDAVWTPSLKELNLAHFYPEDADPADKTQSLGGQAFKELMTQDEKWTSDIYDYADLTPAQLAKKLGKDPSAVMGDYNPKDDRHNPQDPSTWSVNTFKDIRMNAQDGDGKAITPYSNVLEIMSMANTYTYYQDAANYDIFISYAKELWEHSHSYQVGMSDVYYCDGCLSEEAERLEMEALEEEAKAEEMGLSQENPPSLEDSVPANTVILAGAHRAAKESEAAEEAAKAAAAAAETVPESSSAVIVAPVKQTAEAVETAESQTESTEASRVLTIGETTAPEPETEEQETSASQTAEETAAPEITASAESTTAESTGSSESTESAESPMAAETAETESLAADQPDAASADTPVTEDTATVSNAEKAACPGHVDLIIHMKITGLDEQTNNLFAADKTGNDEANIKAGGWPGWNKTTKRAASRLSTQDWFEKYGLTVSNLTPGNPLSPAEINAYMALLPLDISQTRRNLVRFALESVGRIPYYWGGKPSAPDYASNRFGILTSPDYKGRVLKGLDCSGWISWVYWSVTGERLPYESTSGLAVLGKKISRNELQPGDIIVRTGTEAHVIMFLGWTPDGRIQCIHESSSPVNNVTVAVRDANWPYYRSLTD